VRLAVGEDEARVGQVVARVGADHDRAIARRLCGPIPATDLPILLETVIATYLEHRRDSETFATFTQRQPDEQLQALFAEPVPA